MLFNSFLFANFFIIVFCLYLCLNHRWQNRMLLFASYFFYGTWDYRFLSLIIFSTIVDYYCGIAIYKLKDIKRKKIFLSLSIITNLSILGLFKYYNFFLANLQLLLSDMGLSFNPNLLQIILPVGISFYTFQSMSYTIDIYQRKMNPTNRFLEFALFVAFFPQLVAGPIERAKHLLPQIHNQRKITFDSLIEGLYLIFWGLFLKSFIADNLGVHIVDPIFQSNTTYNGTKVLIALYAFSFQIFCDFAGYSNIARGLAKCMGFNLNINFNLPYFSTNPKIFWQRWHISLSRWLKDYLYIPLGGNKNGTIKTYRNLFITMLLGGLWHGAAWTYLIWGAYHGILLITHRIINLLFPNIKQLKIDFLHKSWTFIKMIVFFHLICIGWLIFRSNSLTQAYQMFSSIFNNFEFSLKGIGLKTMVFYLWILIPIQVLQYKNNNLLAIFTFKPIIQVFLYLIIFYALMLFGVTEKNEFIYFQF